MRNKSWLVPCLIAIMGSSALGQRKVAPPPNPSGNGPTLAVTMQFIQEKLGNVGIVNYAAYTHDNIAGTNWGQQVSAEASNVAANAGTCRITYHWKTTISGSVAYDHDAGIPLHDVQNIMVMTGEQNLKQVNSAAGHPAYDTKIDPPIFVLVAQRSGNAQNVFDFTDEDMANRVAKALVHAVELCGGGNKEPF